MVKVIEDEIVETTGFEFVEYLVCGNGNLYGYRKSYDDSLALSSEHNDAVIYGAAYLPTKSELLHREWIKVHTNLPLTRSDKEAIL